jgi:threonine dehydrogenase-like Zn-dependent dehydrogenase
MGDDVCPNFYWDHKFKSAQYHPLIMLKFLFNILACAMFLIMSGQWDVMIVCAGIGGLTAAAMLVKAGLRVLILDRNPHYNLRSAAHLHDRYKYFF